jgi:hypothetical protein
MTTKLIVVTRIFSGLMELNISVYDNESTNEGEICDNKNKSEYVSSKTGKKIGPPQIFVN